MDDAPSDESSAESDDEYDGESPLDLGRRYEHGEGASRDWAHAVRLYRQAECEGVKAATERLKCFYFIFCCRSLYASGSPFRSECGIHCSLVGSTGGELSFLLT